jgi:hypothetical protein
VGVSWNQKDAIAMCILIEAVVPEYGAHVALTGGSLYKQGMRKDADILFYRIRQRKCIDMDGMWAALEKVGLMKVRGFGWCYKATFHGKPVDCFFPEGERDQDGNEVEYRSGKDEEVLF